MTQLWVRRGGERREGGEGRRKTARGQCIETWASTYNVVASPRGSSVPRSDPSRAAGASPAQRQGLATGGRGGQAGALDGRRPIN